MSKAEKAVFFVQHIQDHLDNGESAQPVDRTIPRGEVGCKICEKSIDRIWKERDIKQASMRPDLRQWDRGHPTGSEGKP